MLKIDYKIVTNVLSEYLLTGNVKPKDIEACLMRIEKSQYSHHLELCGLNAEMVRGELNHQVALVRLRLLFSNQSEPSDALINNLIFVCSMFHLLDAYIRADVNDNDLRHQFLSLKRKKQSETALRDIDELDCLIQEMTYRLAFLDAPEDDPNRLERLDVLDSCITTMNRLKAYWHAVLQ